MKNNITNLTRSAARNLWQMVTIKPLSKVILLAGPAFFTTVGEGIQEAIAAVKN